ncbi:uncharacterized protein PV09_08597 [Verruconis gallopava]|uniref:Uncharacterized protein n=1 Tax=Verruconis gallopava TaxID=253628 RepID=A0A0D1ZZC3_9PEZI|nr:uncharacterized protein PV09_08597 [Verruconis gallopava]KIV99792.1 hypothetical protein PV09_08597 [Verruconis gallopava]
MPTDPTLFTQTGPTATSKAPYKGTRIPIEPAPPNETPSQKVARLRAAAQRAKLAQGSTWDRVVHRGRIWADRAHRITATGLIGFSVLFGMYTAFCLGDMIMYNRRKRTEFYAVMEKLRADEYAKAVEAQSRGQATDDQILLINQEQMRFEQMRLDQERKEKGVWRRLKESIVGTEAYEEQKGGKLGLGRKKEETVGEAVSDLLASRDEKLQMGTQKLESAHPPAGGPLDQLGQQTADTVSKTSKSWTSWITGR